VRGECKSDSTPTPCVVAPSYPLWLIFCSSSQRSPDKIEGVWVDYHWAVMNFFLNHLIVDIFFFPRYWWCQVWCYNISRFVHSVWCRRNNRYVASTWLLVGPLKLYFLCLLVKELEKWKPRYSTAANEMLSGWHLFCVSVCRSVCLSLPACLCLSVLSEDHFQLIQLNSGLYLHCKGHLHILYMVT